MFGPVQTQSVTTEDIASCLFAFSYKTEIDATTALEQSSWWSQIKPFIYAIILLVPSTLEQISVAAKSFSYVIRQHR
jgi:hypothetical protein